VIELPKRFDLWLGLLLSAVLCAGSWSGRLPYSLTETLGFVTGAACVYLVIKENIWNFPIGIANNIFFLVLFTGSRLYGDAGLQLVYVVLGIQGWYAWLYGGEQRTALKVARATPRVLAALAAFVLLGTVALTATLRFARGSAPVLDAFTTVLSLAAQYMLNRKLLENWYVWIAADVIYVYLYLTRDLHLTVLLYFVFLCMCIAGLLSWRRTLRGLTAHTHGGAQLSTPVTPAPGVTSHE
jgi:nicotinamide mononucleotide transporter